jgi:hypothetical protein
MISPELLNFKELMSHLTSLSFEIDSGLNHIERYGLDMDVVVYVRLLHDLGDLQQQSLDCILRLHENVSIVGIFPAMNEMEFMSL